MSSPTKSKADRDPAPVLTPEAVSQATGIAPECLAHMGQPALRALLRDAAKRLTKGTKQRAAACRLRDPAKAASRLGWVLRAKLAEAGGSMAMMHQAPAPALAVAKDPAACTALADIAALAEMHVTSKGKPTSGAWAVVCWRGFCAMATSLAAKRAG